VEDVEFRNLRVHTCRYSPDWWGAAEAISITALPRTPHTRVGRIQNIRFENIHCEGENGVVIYGDPGDRIEGLEFQKLHVGIRKETDWPIGVLDVRPFQGGYRPRGGPSIGEETPWGYPVACEPAVFFVGGASQVHFHEVTYAVSTKDRTSWRPIVTDDSMLAESLEIRERSLSI
jgi:hypothetical protein